MGKRSIMAVILLAAALSAGCAGQDKAVQDRVKPVRVVEIKEESNPEILHYSGVIGSDELKKLAFKSSGRIDKIYVEKGQRIKPDDVLAELDKKDLEFGLEASRAQMEAARAVYEKALKGADAEELKNAELNVKKAQDAYDFAADNYKKIETLYSSGGISKNELDKVKLELDLRDSELKQAEETLKQVKRGAREEDKKALFNQFEQAKADYEFKKSLLEDASIKSGAEGFVVDVLYEEDEMVSAGYPVIVVRDDSLIVNVGLAERDLNKVALGTTAEVRVGGNEAEGVVTSISQSPDSQSRTYNIQLSLKRNDFSLGSIAKVGLNIGAVRGIWIPITSMLSDGIDYVYIAKDGIAEKREVVIEGTEGAKALVKGLNPGEKLIVEGMKRLNAGDRIEILK